MRGLILVALLASCVKSDTVQCADGRSCGPGLVCDTEHALCVLREQGTVCAARSDGDACSGDTFAGICDRGYCVSGCSDGAVGYDWGRRRDEECDDGNRRSHDGCSSTCRIELAGWQEWRSPWLGRVNAALAYDTMRTTLVLFGGFTDASATDDHWERDRERRWRRLDIPRPPRRYAAAMVYDAVRNVVVLFGGITTGSGHLDDTWEYDGTTWTEVTPATRPPARGAAMMVFDEVRGTAVLFGGTDSALRDDTWEYDGTTWTQIVTSTQPGPRSAAAFAWDAGRQRAVLFGGNVQNAETWEWNGATGSWTLITTIGGPGPRFGAAMAYHAPSGKLVMHGGTRSNTVTYADFWQYDGATQTWSQIVGQTAPPGRLGASMTFDPESEVIVLLGGRPLGGVGLDDAWEYSFTSTLWSNVSPAFPTQIQARLFEDPVRGELVSLAGSGHTWVFDANQNWVDSAIETAPEFRRRFFGVAYDTARDRAVAFGGDPGNCSPVASTLEWNGDTRDWQVVATSGPSARSVPAAAYDPIRDVIVLSGGVTSVCAGASVLDDTWEYDAISSAWTPTAEDGPAIESMVFAPDLGGIVGLARDGRTWTYGADGWNDLGVPVVPRSGVLGSMTYNRDRRRVTWFGGVPTPTTSDVWELEEGGWREVEVVGQQPVQRIYPAFAAHRPSRSIVLLGGGAFGTTIGDTWLFSYRSDDPDERCGDGEDNDGDHLIDDDDPDCD